MNSHRQSRWLNSELSDGAITKKPFDWLQPGSLTDVFMPQDKFLKVFLISALTAIAGFLGGIAADGWLNTKPFGGVVAIGIACAALQGAIRSAYAHGLQDGRSSTDPEPES